MSFWPFFDRSKVQKKSQLQRTIVQSEKNKSLNVEEEISSDITPFKANHHIISFVNVGDFVFNYLAQKLRSFLNIDYLFTTIKEKKTRKEMDLGNLNFSVYEQ